MTDSEKFKDPADFAKYISSLSDDQFQDLFEAALRDLSQDWGIEKLLIILLYHAQINRSTKLLKRNLMVEFKPDKGLLVFRAEVPPVVEGQP